MWFEKYFTPYIQFIVYDFKAILTPLNENSTDDLTYLSKHAPLRVAIQDTLGKEFFYLVHGHSKHLIKQFIKVLTEK